LIEVQSCHNFGKTAGVLPFGNTGRRFSCANSDTVNTLHVKQLNTHRWPVFAGCTDDTKPHCCVSASSSVTIVISRKACVAENPHRVDLSPHIR
jgi:hypothetical protein